jgi:hypothetical protein
LVRAVYPNFLKGLDVNFLLVVVLVFLTACSVPEEDVIVVFVEPHSSYESSDAGYEDTYQDEPSVDTHPIPEYSEKEPHPCQSEMDELCRYMEELVDRELFDKDHFVYMCRGGGRYRFKCSEW